MLKIFSHHISHQSLVNLLIDALILAVGLLIGFSLQIDGAPALDWRMAVPSALVFAVAMMVLNSAFGLYKPFADASLKTVVGRLALPVVVSMPVAYGVYSVLPWGHFAPDAGGLTAVLLLGFVMINRGIANRGQRSALMARRVLVLGAGEDAALVERVLSGPEARALSIVGFIPTAQDGERCVSPSRIVEYSGRLVELVRREQVDEVIVAVRERRGGILPMRELLDCKMLGIKVLDLSSFYERVQGQVRIESLKASWLIYGEGFRQGIARTVVKRLFDLAASIILLVLALPIMIVAAIAILIEDGAPIFYSQERVGQGGRSFRVIKFRSMRRDAEKDGKPKWAQSNDDRVTRVGRFMRKTRIDELPQLFNVLKGEMSMVGPRPERPYFVDQLTSEIPFYAVRHCVKPGLTGWAQVRYQYGASVDDALQKLQFDLYYVKNHTLFLDSLVLCETVRVVLTGQGAH
ncbi:MAG: TIGR03013 family PEP-CTERM/XrtA system glycosyltransferase [Rhodocyclaceae bacterium]|nr:TIGR03013 family PEP-CTERM/XrtA system glycosyltransferase [Rhodocyclaceae bacterium]